MYFKLIVYSALLIIPLLRSITRFLAVQQELATRSTYYKKRRQYVGKPGVFKTVQLMLATEHLKSTIHVGIGFWLFALAVFALTIYADEMD